MSPPPEITVWQVLARFGVSATRLHALGNHGGFSGAWLWRIETDHGEWCLKAWPPGGSDLGRLKEIHRLMRQASDSGLLFVPLPLAAPDGVTGVEAGNRLWDLTTWMQGRADYRQRPSRERLRAACVALAHLHRAWQPPQPVFRSFPAVRRRIETARSWCALVDSGWRPKFRGPPDDPLTELAELAWDLIERRVAAIPERLKFLEESQVEVQPCLCDVWHDHVLFEQDSVSGFVDFGSVKQDHVTADLARLLGSLAGEDRSAFGDGVDAYNEVRPIGFHDAANVLSLDRTGLLLGIANWLRWLYHDGRTFNDRAAVARRLGELVQRVEQWK
jgi:Ser/Thr protein kinase RdoA (MazF antagonist)